MFPPKGSGLEQIMKALDARHPGLTHGRPIQWPFSFNNMKKPVETRPLNIQNPIQSLQKIQSSVQNAVNDLAQNITATIGQITKKTPQENYNTVVSGFMPQGARLVVPEYPSGTEAILLSDLDGDSENELIASYRHNDGSLRTLILKKLQYNWAKLAEITNSDTTGIHYRNVADLAGNKKKQLLLGLTSNNKYRTLHGYSLHDTDVTELFSKNYSKLEVLGIGKSKTASGKPRIAFWNENDDNTYDIEYMGWDNNRLDSVDSERYYYNKVLPYYTRMVKKDPDNALNWYVLADALAKAGAKNDALNVINYGRKRDKNAEYSDRFLNLANRL